MIFSIDDHIEQIINETKTETRRPTDRYKVGNLYAIQPGRGKPGISEGKIYIAQKFKEWKPDLSDLPPEAIFAKRWRESEASFPIRDYSAKAEGGYTPEEYEELYENMYTDWTVRYAYWFSFFTTEEIEECQSTSRLRLNSAKEVK